MCLPYCASWFLSAFFAVSVVQASDRGLERSLADHQAVQLNSTIRDTAMVHEMAVKFDPSLWNAYRFSFSAIEGGPLPLSEFQGKVMLVVNTASLCAFTPQYRALQDLWEEFGEQGLVVIGLPSADFGGQEYADRGKIKEFCEVNFNVTFPLADPISVLGENAHPFYGWVEITLGRKEVPRWNFHKYLIDRNGHLVGSYGSNVKPDGPEIGRAIRELLGQTAS